MKITVEINFDRTKGEERSEEDLFGTVAWVLDEEFGEATYSDEDAEDLDSTYVFRDCRLVATDSTQPTLADMPVEAEDEDDEEAS